MKIKKPELVWTGGLANVGLYYMQVNRHHACWTWKVDDGERYHKLAEGTASDEASAQRAAVNALAAHLDEMTAMVRAWRAAQGDAE